MYWWLKDRPDWPPTDIDVGTSATSKRTRSKQITANT
jgi:hypothetical protein